MTSISRHWYRPGRGRKTGCAVCGEPEDNMHMHFQVDDFSTGSWPQGTHEAPPASGVAEAGMHYLNRLEGKEGTCGPGPCDPGVRMETIAKLQIDGQTWHVYQRGKGGELALSIVAPGGTHIDMRVSPAVLRMVGGLLLGAGKDQRLASS